MDIWKVCMTITENRIRFDTELQPGAYKESEDLKNWISFDGWLCSIIPKDIEIETIYGGYKAVKGLDFNPNNEDLEKIKQEMIKILINAIEENKKEVVNRHEKMLKKLKENMRDD